MDGKECMEGRNLLSFLRHNISNPKVIQDMNSLKRLLREAETDHYALFR
jgi:hypothetical protein